MEHVGERIKHLRKERRWTQTELAERVNVSSQVVSNWERHYTDPDHDDIARLSREFKVSSDYLLGRTKEPHQLFTEDEKDLLNSIDLSDEDLLKKFNFKYDGKELSEELKRRTLAVIRAVIESEQHLKEDK